MKTVPSLDVVKVLNANPKYNYTYALPFGLDNLLIQRMLTGKLRQLVIKVLKDPLRLTLIKVGKRFVKVFGGVTKENTILRNTHLLIDKRQQFSEHYTNSSRAEMLQAGWELFLSEYEHDSHYRWLFDWLLRQLYEEIRRGNWVFTNEPFPDKGCWKED